MHILIPTDVFPPGNVGGAAWSSFTLAQALRANGHQVIVVVPTRRIRGIETDTVSGIPTLWYGYTAPRIPFVQNYARHEQLWSPLASVLIEIGKCWQQPLVIHAQHVQTVPAAVLAGSQVQAPVVATVRDHWPWDYFATGLHGNTIPYTPTSAKRTLWALLTDLPARLGPLPGIAALPAMPYILAHVQRRAMFLAQAQATIAVSTYIAQRLRPIVPGERLHTIPNMVDITRTEHVLHQSPDIMLNEPFMLYIGKLERNKGAGLLRDVFQHVHTLKQTGQYADVSLPLLVIVGSGALEEHLARDMAALGVPARFLSWVDHDEVLRLIARCELLLFPSCWGEPLSRVLLEASVVGSPIVAMATGGTPDIIIHEQTGILVRTVEQCAEHMLRLLKQPQRRAALRQQARASARARFAVEVVLPRYEQLYASVIP